MAYVLIRRPATVDDVDLLYQILEVTMRKYAVQTWGVWDESSHRRQFEESTLVHEHRILEIDGQVAGSLWMSESSLDIRLHRLFILPEFQNKGVGSQILTEIATTADAKGLPVRLRVLRVNPARRLYERFGFVVTEETETHYLMERVMPGRVLSTQS